MLSKETYEKLIAYIKKITIMMLVIILLKDHMGIMMMYFGMVIVVVRAIHYMKLLSF